MLNTNKHIHTRTTHMHNTHKHITHTHTHKPMHVHAYTAMHTNMYTHRQPRHHTCTYACNAYINQCFLQKKKRRWGGGGGASQDAIYNCNYQTPNDLNLSNFINTVSIHYAPSRAFFWIDKCMLNSTFTSDCSHTSNKLLLKIFPLATHNCSHTCIYFLQRYDESWWYLSLRILLKRWIML